MEKMIIRLKKLMEERGITQKELAKLIGKPLPTVNNWFGRRAVEPKLTEVVNIAAALEVSLDYLATGKDRDGVPLYLRPLIVTAKQLPREDIVELTEIAGLKLERLNRKLGMDSKGA